MEHWLYVTPLEIWKGGKRRLYTAVDTKGKFIPLPEHGGDQQPVRIALARGLYWTRELSVPIGIRRTLAEFLTWVHPTRDDQFDDYFFVTWLHRLSPHDFSDLHRFWDVSHCRQIFFPFIRAGDVFFFTGDEDIFCKAALYIGAGLCMSVDEIDHTLFVSTIHDIKRDYGAKYIFIARPK